jgi:hypothetical protein
MERSVSILHYLQEWGSLTEAESQCIQAENWEGLSGIHQEKKAIQQAIQRHDRENPSHKPEPPEIKDFASRLCLLEEQNRKALEVIMDSVESRLKTSDRTIRSLRNVQQAYGASSSSFWQSYS